MVVVAVGAVWVSNAENLVFKLDLPLHTISVILYHKTNIILGMGITQISTLSVSYPAYLPF